MSDLPFYFSASLSVEELALAFGAISRADLGQNLLGAVYTPEGLSHEMTQAYLAAAAHSLAARGLCDLGGSLRLQPDLEQAVFAMAHFDSLVVASRVQDDLAVETTVHVQARRGFSAHTSYEGIVHEIVLGSYEQLPAFLSALYPHFGASEGQDWMLPAQVSLGWLAKAAQPNAARAVDALLPERSTQAASLEEALGRPALRGAVMFAGVSSQTAAEDLEDAPQTGMLLFKGLEGSWMFTCQGAAEDTPCQGMQVTRRTFEEQIAQRFFESQPVSG